MKAKPIETGLVILLLVACALQAGDYFEKEFGSLLPASSEQVRLWWASSGWKIGRDRSLPKESSQAVLLRCAGNEAEAVQLVIRPIRDMANLTVELTDLSGPEGAKIPAQQVDLLRVRYVHVTHPTDDSSVTGHWPDPLPPLKKPISVKAGQNQPIWIRINVPGGTRAGTYQGTIQIRADAYQADVPLRLMVYDFSLPDQMSCVTAFGFSPGNVYRYQGLKTEQQKRAVLDKYWANFSAHHISPYDPAPLDPIQVQWPAITPPPLPWDDWDNLRRVSNETHNGDGAMLIFDMDTKSNVTTSYKPLIRIPPEGLCIRFWYRTAVSDHAFNVAMNHYDADGQWMSGRNNDMTFTGNGRWQEFDLKVTEFPAAAHFVRINARATQWTNAGEAVGLVWFDDISVSNPKTGQEYLAHGDFERAPRAKPPLPAQALRPQLDCRAWDRAMQRALDHYHFNSFRLGIPGIGGGTFHARSVPHLLGFTEDTPEYPILFESYCQQMEQHLEKRGWLDEAFVYWFDEPLPKDYDYVMNGFAKLKAAAPKITRMLTVMKGVEEPLYGGPQIWCAISNRYEHDIAQTRRQHGEKFWWYICTGPKAPYCTLFIDHPGTELRAWLWQTWQRNIEGILVWQSNYWTSDTAYPDHPQNPYEDPMGWRVGYGTPRGEKRPWGNGDGRFIYPPEDAAHADPAGPVLAGPVDSQRWEMLRDGIEDYEYLTILKELIGKHETQLTAQQRKHYAALMEVPNSITSDMTHFTYDPAPIEAQRHRVAQAITALKKLERD
jgi:hypothetical protein